MSVVQYVRKYVGVHWLIHRLCNGIILTRNNVYSSTVCVCLYIYIYIGEERERGGGWAS